MAYSTNKVASNRGGITSACVMFAASSLLIVASLLKLFTICGNCIENCHFGSCWITLFVCLLEFTVGIGFFSRAGRTKGYRLLLALLFLILLSVSVFNVFSGVEDCRCLGPVSSNPKHMAMLNAAILVGILSAGKVNPGGRFDTSGIPKRIVVGLCVAVSLAGVYRLVYYQPAGLKMRPGLVYFNPDAWVGGTLPFQELGLDSNRIVDGSLDIWLARRDCPKCLKAIKSHNSGRVPVVVVFLPDGGSAGKLKRYFGHSVVAIPDTRLWVGPTPVLCQVRFSKVAQVIRFPNSN